MTEMTQHWLHKFCRKGGISFFLEPWWFTANDGCTWSAATNGYVMVAIKGRVDGLRKADGKDTKKLVKLLATVADDPKPVSLPDLKVWLGPPEWPHTETIICPKCHGTGTVECSECGQDTDCECDGGKVEQTSSPMEREGLLFGALINRNRLVQALEHLDGPATVGTGGGKFIIVYGSDWRVCLVTMDVGKTGVAAATARFPIQVAK